MFNEISEQEDEVIESSLDDLSKRLFKDDQEEEVKEKYKPNLYVYNLFSDDSKTTDEDGVTESNLAKTIRKSGKTNTNLKIKNLKQKRRASRNKKTKSKNSEVKFSFFNFKSKFFILILISKINSNKTIVYTYHP